MKRYYRCQWLTLATFCNSTAFLCSRGISPLTTNSGLLWEHRLETFPYASVRAAHSSWREDEGKYRRTNLKAESIGGIQHRNKCSYSDHWVQVRAKIGLTGTTSWFEVCPPSACNRNHKISCNAQNRIARLSSHWRAACWMVAHTTWFLFESKETLTLLQLMDIRKMRGHWGQEKAVERLGMNLSRCRCVIVLISAWKCSY